MSIIKNVFLHDIVGEGLIGTHLEDQGRLVADEPGGAADDGVIAAISIPETTPRGALGPRFRSVSAGIGSARRPAWISRRQNDGLVPPVVMPEVLGRDIPRLCGVEIKTPDQTGTIGLDKPSPRRG